MEKNEIGKILPMTLSLDCDFTKAEKKVAKYILENTGEVIYLTIVDFSGKIEVGEATIIRFCRKLGFKGYHDFKMSLAQEFSLNKQNDRILNEALENTDSLEVIGQKMLNSSKIALEETLTLLNFTVLDEVVNLFKNLKRIYFFGVGFSGIAAIEGKYKFMQVGLKTDSYSDNHFMAMKAATLNSNDLVVGISQSGRAAETIKGLELAQKQGAKTVAITHYAKSPITKVADYTLLNGSTEGELQGGAASTKMAQLFVLELIYTKLLMVNEEETIELKKKAKEAIKASIY